MCDKNAARLLGQQGGQAVLEYILVLVVVVAIILGGFYQMNTAFKVWAQSYFGDYLSCLLETGELPALGGAVNAAGGICNDLYEPFSIDKGRPLLTQVGDGSSGGTSNTGTSSKPTTSQSQQNSSSSISQKGVREGSGGSSGSSQINPSARFNAGGKFRPGDNQSSSNKRSTGSTYTGSTDGSIPLSFLGSGMDGRNKVTSGMSLDYSMEVERTRKPITTASGGIKSEDSAQERGRKKAAPLRGPASVTKMDDDDEMTFGSFLRYLVIAAIIIALVLVVGGQLFQISKSSGSD